MPSICFYSQDHPYTLKNKLRLKRWLLSAIKSENKSLGDVNCVFCSDEYLHQLNVQYLNHDTFTDIITFDYSEKDKVSGDLFISIDRVQENAQKFKTSVALELNRVMVHGVLHLCGYKDKKPQEQKLMRSKEDYYLSLLENSSF